MNIYFIAPSALTFNNDITVSTTEIWIMQFRFKAKQGLYQKCAEHIPVRPLNSGVTPMAKSCLNRLRNCRDERSGQRARLSQFMFKSHNLRRIKYRFRQSVKLRKCGGLAPHVLNLGMQWKSMARFTIAHFSVQITSQLE